jgi:hypothetical protein
MTVVTFNTAPRLDARAPKLQALFKTFCTRLSATLDKYVAYRMQRAVPESALRQAERDINRVRRLMGKSSSHQRHHLKAAAGPAHRIAQSTRVQ